MKTISVWLSRLPSISWNFVLHGERSTSRGISHGLGRNGDQSALTMSTRGSKILKESAGQIVNTVPVKHIKRAPAPLLEAVVDGHPDVKVDFRLGDVVAGQELTEARGVLLQHVPVVFPSAAVSEHLQQRRSSR